MAKTFEQYKAEYAREPFPFPMPGGASILIEQPDLEGERAAVVAATASGSFADGLYNGLMTYVGDADREEITAAWGKLPASALSAVIEEMRDHFGTKNS